MKTAILKYISENPGKNKTQIFQGTSAIPVKCNKYILDLVINGLIEIEGKNGTYSITEKGNEYLDSKILDKLFIKYLYNSIKSNTFVSVFGMKNINKSLVIYIAQTDSLLPDTLCKYSGVYFYEKNNIKQKK